MSKQITNFFDRASGKPVVDPDAPRSVREHEWAHAVQVRIGTRAYRTFCATEKLPWVRNLPLIWVELEGWAIARRRMRHFGGWKWSDWWLLTQSLTTYLCNFWRP